jgi:hypothetical protein
VLASDRAFNTTRSTPACARFVVTQDLSAAGDAAPQAPGRAIACPNPSQSGGDVRILGLAEPIVIFDAAGRRVAGSEDGVRRVGDALVWNGKSRGRTAPSGLYWARGSDGGRVVQLIRIP